MTRGPASTCTAQRPLTFELRQFLRDNGAPLAGAAPREDTGQRRRSHWEEHRWRIVSTISSGSSPASTINPDLVRMSVESFDALQQLQERCIPGLRADLVVEASYAPGCGSAHLAAPRPPRTRAPSCFKVGDEHLHTALRHLLPGRPEWWQRSVLPRPDIVLSPR